MTDQLWKNRFRTAWWLCGPMAIGLAMILGFWIASVQDKQPPASFIILAVVLFVPGAFYLYLLTIWHWKSRYRGRHSDLWGGLILLETTGWFKLIYLFRHIVPDMRGTGRYRDFDIQSSPNN